METKKGVFKIRALVDLRAEANCIKRKAVLLIGGPISANKLTLLMTPNGGRIYSYGDSVLRLTVADTHGERREADVRFTLYDFGLSEVDMILGYL